MRKIAFLVAVILSATIFCAASKENPYEIFVDGEAKKLYLLENGILKKEYKCAIGKASTPTPIGSFKVVAKDRWGEGFGGRWIGIDCPWGKFGIHGTIFPNSIGWCSSKGCIRMYNDDVAELYGIIPHGTKVTITNGAYGDFGSGFRHIKIGEYGADVLRIQKRLAELGYFKGYANGKYEDPLKAAIQQYQKNNGFAVSNTITPRVQESLGFVLME